MCAKKVHKANTRGRAIQWFEEVDAKRAGIVDQFSMIGEGKEQKAEVDEEFTRYLMAFVGADPIAEEKGMSPKYCVFTFTGIEDLLGAQYMMLYGTDFLKSYEADRIESMRKMLADYEQHKRPFDYRVVRYLESMHKKGLLDPPPSLEMRGIDATQEPVKGDERNEAQQLADAVFVNKNSLDEAAKNSFLVDFLTQLARQQYKALHVHEPTLRDFERDVVRQSVTFKKAAIGVMVNRLTEEQPSNFLEMQAAIERWELATVALAKANRANQRWAKKRDGPMPANGERIGELHKALQEAKQAMDAEIKAASIDEIRREAEMEVPRLMNDDMKTYTDDEDRIEREAKKEAKQLKREAQAQREALQRLLVQGIDPDKNAFVGGEAEVERDVEEEEMDEEEADVAAAIAMDLGGSKEEKQQRALGDAVSTIVDELWYPQDIESRRAILNRDPHPDTPVASWLQDQVVPHYAAVWHYLVNIPKGDTHPEHRPLYVSKQPPSVEPWQAMWRWAFQSKRDILWGNWDSFIADFKTKFWNKAGTRDDFYESFEEDTEGFYNQLMRARDVGVGTDTKKTTKADIKKLEEGKFLLGKIKWRKITANHEEMGVPMQLFDNKDGRLREMLERTLSDPSKDAKTFILPLASYCKELDDRAKQMRFVVLLFDWCRCIFTMMRILKMEAKTDRPLDPVLLGCIDDCAEHAARLISGNNILRQLLTKHRKLQTRAHLAHRRHDLEEAATKQGIPMDQLDWLVCTKETPDNVIEALNGRNPRDQLEQDSVLKLLATGKPYRSPFAGVS